MTNTGNGIADHTDLARFLPARPATLRETILPCRCGHPRDAHRGAGMFVMACGVCACTGYQPDFPEEG